MWSKINIQEPHNCNVAYTDRHGNFIIYYNFMSAFVSMLHIHVRTNIYLTYPKNNDNMLTWTIRQQRRLCKIDVELNEHVTVLYLRFIIRCC